MFENQEFQIIMLAPVNFAEIVAKTRTLGASITAKQCEEKYAEAQKLNRQACVFICQFDPTE